jgi:hypothetical protein
MSTKLIIYLTGKPSLRGFKIREFVWSAPHGCYIYEGKEIEPAAFNEKYEKATRNNSDLLVRVKVTQNGDAVPTPAPQPVALRELTVEDAEAILQRHAPERLKKKTGPKPREVMEVS